MKRGGPLRANPDRAKAWRQRSKRLNPVSAKRRAGSQDRRTAVAEAFERDGHRCRLLGYSRCFGPLTPHRLKKGSAGGGYTLDNVVALCQFHNGMIEDEPILAESLGMVRR